MPKSLSEGVLATLTSWSADPLEGYARWLVLADGPGIMLRLNQPTSHGLVLDYRELSSALTPRYVVSLVLRTAPLSRPVIVHTISDLDGPAADQILRHDGLEASVHILSTRAAQALDESSI